ncbi:OsmC family protein [Carboxylicivirga sp. M1479]|uniref:OsmC family protein n=1 Tax=Carboxylicivirga sp. M1479 TaxID=2594476 RepID=UPI00117878F7|nr:OsmC family protein [Carboxylicivirga sp. M1479]TRX71588.1 OsmC family protein [Carboxylicivirga sp. M1479]
MKTTTKIEWTGNMSFETELFGHKLTLDAGTDNGGEDKGPRPKILMLTALAGCTGMDIVSILKKMRVDVEDLQIIVEGDMTEEHPKYYEKMHIIYQFKGQNLPIDKLEKAVNLSEEKYCGVSALYKKAIPVTTEIQLID